MRPGQQNKRSRGRGNGGRKNPNPLSRNYESNGPDVRVRGNPASVAEKYVQLARDSQASGDSVMAENYLQHAEHYFRIISAAQAQSLMRQEERDRAEQTAQNKSSALVDDETSSESAAVQGSESRGDAETAGSAQADAETGDAGGVRPRRIPRTRRVRRTRMDEKPDPADASVEPQIDLSVAEQPNMDSPSTGGGKPDDGVSTDAV